jgi:hypothetical protein
MYRDDVSRLYKYLGQPSQNYLDFQTEDDFRERMRQIAARRKGGVQLGVQSGASSRRSKIVAVVSMGNLPGRKLVSGLAWVASRRLQGKVPVHVVDLIPVNDHQEEKSFLFSNGIRHVLIDTSEPSVRMAVAREAAWLEHQLAAEHDDGLIFVDVPERVMHARHHAMAAADMVLVLVPAAMNAVRAVEDIESELAEALLPAGVGRLRYLLVAAKDHEILPSWLQSELMLQKDMFVPLCLHAEAIPGMKELSAGLQPESAEYRNLADICNYLFGELCS